MIYPWKLNYWQSGEWQVVNERLKKLEKSGVHFNPPRSELFGALRRTSDRDVKVVLLGQDPYPDHRFCTGLAFSIPEGIGPKAFPLTLQTIFKEYHADLRYPIPDKGDLSRWAAQGVLLWNAIPTCESGKSLSHDWTEYSQLTREVVERCSERGVVFAFLGSVARRYLEYVDLTKNEVILTSHPSPRGIKFSKTPFEGSRLFSTINDKLNSQGLEPINWRLDGPEPEKERSGADPTTGSDHHGVLPRVLPNLTGASCGPLLDSRGICIRE
jgi:uracil-DNA glycosylase